MNMRLPSGPKTKINCVNTLSPNQFLRVVLEPGDLEESKLSLVQEKNFWTYRINIED